MSVLLVNGNSLSIPLADESVHCVVTSPPYWGLRDYGTATWQGGDAECDHNPQRPDGGERADRSLPLGRGGLYRDTCGKCGAIRLDNQLGLERTPEEYMANMVVVFREVWRVLRKDGTCWVNLGDSYTGSKNSGGDSPRVDGGTPYKMTGLQPVMPAGLKPKDLCGIPWRVAFALQADGWYLRSDIIWSKPNPMPESVTDRPTKAHEYLFLLAKAQKYYYDADAVREEMSDATKERDKNGFNGAFKGQFRGTPGEERWQDGRPIPEPHFYNPAGRNRRTVWEIATQPYSGAHFATFPEKLVEPCIKAGCPAGAIVFDPFAGSGTTLVVARKLGRHGIGLDLSRKYLAENARTRLGLDKWDAWVKP